MEVVMQEARKARAVRKMMETEGEEDSPVMKVSLTLGIQRFPMLPGEASSGDDPAPQAKKSNRDATSPKPRCRPISTLQESVRIGPLHVGEFPPLLFLMLLYQCHVTTKPTVKMSQAKHQHSRCSE